MPDVKVLKSSRFEQEVRELLAPDQRVGIVASLEWVLRQRAEFGARVRGTSLQAWPVFPGDGHGYVAFYQVIDTTVTLTSLVKRPTPLAPHFFDLED